MFRPGADCHQTLRRLAPTVHLAGRTVDSVADEGTQHHERLPGTEATASAEYEAETVQGRPHRITWARPLKRVFDIDMQQCPNCITGEFNITRSWRQSWSGYGDVDLPGS